MERDSFVFYRSFYEAISCLSKEEKADCLDALAGYALNGVEPEADGVVKALFLSWKPQIDANNRRYLNGCKGAEYGRLGGRPKKNEGRDLDKNPIGVSSKNPKKTPNVNVNVNDNDNDNVNDNENVNVNEKKKRPAQPKKAYGENGMVKLTDKEHDMLIAEYGVGMTSRAIDYLDGYIVDKGYKSKSNYMAIKRWVIDAVKEKAQRVPKQADDFFADIRGESAG